MENLLSPRSMVIRFGDVVLEVKRLKTWNQVCTSFPWQGKKNSSEEGGHDLWFSAEQASRYMQGSHIIACSPANSLMEFSETVLGKGIVTPKCPRSSFRDTQ